MASLRKTALAALAPAAFALFGASAASAHPYYPYPYGPGPGLYRAYPPVPCFRPDPYRPYRCAGPRFRPYAWGYGRPWPPGPYGRPYRYRDPYGWRD